MYVQVQLSLTSAPCCHDNCAHTAHVMWCVAHMSLQAVRTLLEAQCVRLVLQPLLMQHDVGPQAGWRPGAPVQHAIGVAVCTLCSTFKQWYMNQDPAKSAKRLMMTADAWTCCLTSDQQPAMRVCQARKGFVSQLSQNLRIYGVVHYLVTCCTRPCSLLTAYW